MKKLKVIKGWKSLQTAIKMQTFGFGGFYGIGKRSCFSLSAQMQVSQNDEIVHKSPVIECLVPPLHTSIKDYISAPKLAAAVPSLWPVQPPALQPRISSPHSVCSCAPYWGSAKFISIACLMPEVTSFMLQNNHADNVKRFFPTPARLHDHPYTGWPLVHSTALIVSSQ